MVYIKASRTDKQREAQKEVERNRWNRYQQDRKLRLTPNERHSIITRS